MNFILTSTSFSSTIVILFVALYSGDQSLGHLCWRNLQYSLLNQTFTVSFRFVPDYYGLCLLEKWKEE